MFPIDVQANEGWRPGAADTCPLPFAGQESDWLCLFPWAVSCMVEAGHPGMAAAVLLRKASVHPALASVEGGAAVLQRYLRACSAMAPPPPLPAGFSGSEVLPRTAAHLREGVNSKCRAAMRCLAEMVR